MRPPKHNILGPLEPNKWIPPLGRKKVYLPNFTLTLLRTPFSPPNFATFITPLSMNKLDIKDYLYNLYNVKVLSVRSYVQQARVRQDKPGARYPKPHRWYRPRATKRMTIEMPATTPFLYPPPPTDFSPWDQETQKKAEESAAQERKSVGPEARSAPKGDAKSLKKQAEELLSGRKAWRPGWVDWDVAGGRGKGGLGAEVGF